MAEVIFIKPTDINTRQNTNQNNDSFSDRIKAIEQMNPRIDRHEISGDFVPILLAESEDDEKLCKEDFEIFKRNYARLEPVSKKVWMRSALLKVWCLLRQSSNLNKSNFLTMGRMKLLGI